MTPNLTYVIMAAGLIGCGVYLLLARSIVRALVGVILMGNGINVLFMVASGPAGEVPIIGEGDGTAIADPVPQAMVLTAIVITLGLTAFVLALAHRSWQLDRSDLYADDPESSRIHQKAESNDVSDAGDVASAAAIAAEVAESEGTAEELAEEELGDRADGHGTSGDPGREGRS